jgi:hypothetical protein
MNKISGAIGKRLAVYLSKELEINASAPPSNPLHLQATLRTGDVLLVEGNTRISAAIKHL